MADANSAKERLPECPREERSAPTAAQDLGSVQALGPGAPTESTGRSAGGHRKQLGPGPENDHTHDYSNRTERRQERTRTEEKASISFEA